MSGHAYSNRLLGSASPYLLQHAKNPVDWWPWGQEAFTRARELDVPILLSIGYSTCYWCHVMERECFSDPVIAELLNARFVCIKVDREERPDIDDLYMTATQISTGHGGWPMTVFLEPHRLRPFYCGTYFPPVPAPRHAGLPSLPQLAEGISSAWNENRPAVLEAAQSLTSAVEAELAQARESVGLDAGCVERAIAVLLSTHDQINGGFGSKPKFPQPGNLKFLLDARELVADPSVLTAIDAAVQRTLEKMACGGIFDQVGGGFHRYAVDHAWQIPHFEKMLYDNAQLLGVYARAAELYQQPDYARIAQRIFDFINRDMSDPSGGIYSAVDAEVDGREGLNYVWDSSEIEQLLPDMYATLATVYELDCPPNFVDPHHPSSPPAHVIRMAALPGALAARLGMPRSQLLDLLTTANRRLLDARSLRPQPRIDDKLITAWNAMTACALAGATLTLEKPSFLERAGKIIDCIEHQLLGSDRRLSRCARQGQGQTEGFLEDYAWTIAALCAVCKASHALGTDSGRALQSAIDFAYAADSLFSSPDGGFFDVSTNRSELFLRPRSIYDTATPAGQSVMLHALLDLAELSGDQRWHERALRLLGSLSGSIQRNPLACINATRGVVRCLKVPSLAGRLKQFGPVQELSTSSEHARADWFTPVEVYADTDTLEIGPNVPCEFAVRVQIAPGYHLIAAEPGLQGEEMQLHPLRVFLLSGSGVAVYADYPQGQPFGEGELLVYRDSVTIRVALEQVESTIHHPLIGVRFQACDDSSCQLPTTVELDIAIHQIASG